MRSLTGFTQELLQVCVGLLAWSLYVGAVYVWTSLSCSGLLDGAQVLGLGALDAGLLAATLVALVAAVVALAVSARRARRRARPNDHFLGVLGAWTATFALIAISWSAVPALLLPTCSEPSNRAAWILVDGGAGDAVGRAAVQIARTSESAATFVLERGLGALHGTLGSGRAARTEPR